MQSVQHLLYENGFGDVWLNPQSVNKETFHNHFKQRLKDQFVQGWNSKLEASNRFDTLKIIHHDYKVENYVTAIRNPCIREVFTRLRIDLNILASSKTHGRDHNPMCIHCNDEHETV